MISSKYYLKSVGVGGSFDFAQDKFSETLIGWKIVLYPKFVFQQSQKFCQTSKSSEEVFLLLSKFDKIKICQMKPKDQAQKKWN